MTKKLVSFIFLVALVATSVFMMNTGLTYNTSYEYKSNFVSQVNNHDSLAQSGQRASVSSKISALNDQRDFAFSQYNTNITTNQQTYKPGDWVNTTARVGYNGSLSWAINSPNPNDKPVFSPTKSATDIFFKDPNFNNASKDQLVDWQNTGFTNNNGTNLLNVTYSGSGRNVLSYHQYNDIKGTFEVSFNYLRNYTSSYNNNMTLEYWNGTTSLSIPLNQSTNNGMANFDQVLTLDTTNPSVTLPLNFTIDTTTSSPSTWLIYPISISYHEANIPFTDNTMHTGSLQNVWVHGSQNVTRDIVTVFYYVNKSTTENSYTLVSFNFTLPKFQVYIGEWQFGLTVNPIDSHNNPITGAAFTIKMPFVVQYNVYFQMMRQYVYRGTNSTDSSAIYKDETNSTTVFSPTDKVVYVGQLFTNVTNTKDYLDGSYFSDVTGLLNSSTTILGTKSYSWTDNGFSSYYQNNTFQQQSLEQVLPNSLKNNYTWIIQNTIPNRGIYGTVNQTLHLTFPTGLTEVNTTSGQTYFTHGNSSVNLNPATVEFNLNVTKYTTPFSRTWFLTEFMEGNFSVSTWRYNSTGIEATNNVTGQSFPLKLDIPVTDLAFSVYLQDNSTGAIGQQMQVELLSNTTTFYFAGAISSNLNTLHMYHLGIQWLNPEYTGTQKAQDIEFSPTYSAMYSIKGTLTVQVPLNVLQFRQGDNFVVKFNVTIDQLNGKPAAGLNLNAVIENSSSLAPVSSFSPQITEADGVFTVFMTLHYDTPLGTYVCQIYKTSTGTPIGSFQFQILSHPVNSQDITTVIPFVYSFFGAILGVVVLLGFAIMFLKFKK